MINFSIHNVTDLSKARVSSCDNTDPSNRSGWLVINAIAENYSWEQDEPQDQIPSEVTFFLKNKELALAQLRDAIDKAILANKREEVEAATAKEATANG